MERKKITPEMSHYHTTRMEQTSNPDIERYVGRRIRLEKSPEAQRAVRESSSANPSAQANVETGTR